MKVDLCVHRAHCSTLFRKSLKEERNLKNISKDTKNFMTFFIVANMIYFEKKIAFLALHEDIKQKGFS
jgi:hypothetical protein